tara:strand:+ start:3662 stop:4000 length:339 start_codon:yes stop_codon:yes gene_type:complete
MYYSTPQLYNSVMFDTSDHFKILLMNNIYNYLNELENRRKFKSDNFELLIKMKYFTNSTIDKNNFWNEIKHYNIKIIKLKSFLEYYKKSFIIEAETFSKIDSDCRQYISSFL